jgi:hypothetical protein
MSLVQYWCRAGSDILRFNADVLIDQDDVL